MEQTISPKANTADLLAELESRYGGVMGQAIYDQLTRVHAPDHPPECLEVLQLSEIAHRLRAHVRDLIRQYRTSNGVQNTWPANVVTLLGRSGGKDEISRAYRLYRKMNADFHALYKDCMTAIETVGPCGPRRWYDARPGNDAARRLRMN